MVNDHDEIVRHGEQLKAIAKDIRDLSTGLAEQRQSLNTKLDGVGRDLSEVKEQVRVIRAEDQLVTDARITMWQRVETLWSERPTKDQMDQRLEFVRQHRAMWQAFSTAKWVGALLILEQPVMLAIWAWLMKG